MIPIKVMKVKENSFGVKPIIMSCVAHEQCKFSLQLQNKLENVDVQIKSAQCMDIQLQLRLPQTNKKKKEEYTFMPNAKQKILFSDLPAFQKTLWELSPSQKKMVLEILFEYHDAGLQSSLLNLELIINLNDQQSRVNSHKYQQLIIPILAKIIPNGIHFYPFIIDFGIIQYKEKEIYAAKLFAQNEGNDLVEVFDIISIAQQNAGQLVVLGDFQDGKIVVRPGEICKHVATVMFKPRNADLYGTNAIDRIYVITNDSLVSTTYNNLHLQQIPIKYQLYSQLLNFKFHELRNKSEPSKSNLLKEITFSTSLLLDQQFDFSIQSVEFNKTIIVESTFKQNKQQIGFHGKQKLFTFRMNETNGLQEKTIIFVKIKGQLLPILIMSNENYLTCSKVSKTSIERIVYNNLAEKKNFSNFFKLNSTLCSLEGKEIKNCNSKSISDEQLYFEQKQFNFHHIIDSIPKKLCSNEKILLDFQKIALGETKIKYLTISNYNQNLIAIEKFECSSIGLIIYFEYVIDINGRKLERRIQLTKCDNSSKKINLKIESGQQAILSFKLSFNQKISGTTTVRISTQMEKFNIQLKYEVISGNVTVAPVYLQFPPTIPYNTVTKEIFLKNNFEENLMVKAIFSDDPRFLVALSSNQVPKNGKSIVATVTFDPARIDNFLLAQQPLISFKNSLTFEDLADYLQINKVFELIYYQYQK